MSANRLDLPSLSLTQIGGTCFGEAVDTLVQCKQPDMGLLILPYGIKSSYVSYCPAVAKKVRARIWGQVSLKCLFWWFPGWSAGTGEMGETQMKGIWLHLRALCLWSALLCGLVQQCLRLERCWITSTQGLAAQYVSELQLLWSVLPTWAMGATKTNYWTQDIEVCCQDSQSEVKTGVSGIFHAQMETSIKAPLVLMKGEFGPGAVTFKTSQTRK